MSRARVMVRLLRADQWVKNVFVFGGLLFGGRLGDPVAVARALVAFGLFSVVASAAYIHNDVADREADRLHPKKAQRPIASGAVSLPVARAVQLGLLVLGLAGAALFDRRVTAILLGYTALNAAYSHWLKHVVVLDVMLIAVGFVLRVLAGCAAVAVRPSTWIILCTFLLALFMGFGKRRHELTLLGAGRDEHRPVLGSYGVGFLDQMIGVVSAVTVMCYIMYTVWPDTVALHGTTALVYTVPFVIYGIFRYDFLVYKADRGGSPTSIILTDRPLLLAVVLWAVTSLALLNGTWRRRVAAVVSGPPPAAGERSVR
ncbi:MAG TPA: decaprenyl-phosphate phosphoribosyltransferase [Candidatus Binatia bacterium]|nr:decaprenyl-phosphate phosphoribosyltransferase [Candidatus Binatia bacterium]